MFDPSSSAASVLNIPDRIRAAGRHALSFRTVVVTALIVVGLQVAGYFVLQSERAVKLAIDTRLTTATDLSRALSQGEDALHNLLADRGRSSLGEYYSKLRDVELLAANMNRGGHSDPQTARLTRELGTLVQGWRRTVAAYETGDFGGASAALTLPHAESVMSDTLAKLGAAIERDRAASQAQAAHIWMLYNWLFWLQIMFATLMVTTIFKAYRGLRREAEARGTADTGQAMARRRLELLFGMHDMLQSAEDHRDANLILSSTAARLAPDAAGALYVFNNSGDRLQLSTTWNGDGMMPCPPQIVPAECWALKRGKPHLNDLSATSLRCVHVTDPVSPSIEVPMIARGNVLGMLMLSQRGADDEAALAELRIVATALADGMSLALSNMALRERLRNQALRDGLTGLYNRRYMEDILERLVDASGTDGPSTSLIMIDLDHFKRINDEHGHAVGDSILREVGSLMLTGLRKTDVACRYGGEELVLILPGCEHDGAVERAQTLRGRIEALSDSRAFRITASFGVATTRAHGRTATDLLRSADAALYAAKDGGRNRVVSAAPTTRLPGPPDEDGRLHQAA